MRLGYKEQVSHYPSPIGSSNRYTYRLIDAGVNYARPLSISRRTTMSISTGSAAYANTTETFYTLTASASLHHEINRTWVASVVYQRGLSVVVGFPEPFFSDAVTATIQGRLARQVTLVGSAGLSNGHVGLGSATNNYDSIQATTRLEWTVQVRTHRRVRQLFLSRLSVRSTPVDGDTDTASGQSQRRQRRVDVPNAASEGKDATCYQVRHTHRKTSSGSLPAAGGRSCFRLSFIALATVVVAHYLPNRYRSETVILVVPQQVPESYVRSTITTKIEDRLQSISQQILSRTRLERIIQDFNLYERERQVGIMEDVVERMRSRDIKVETLKGDAFRIAFIGDNPVTVMRVTDRLASHFIDENLRDREILAQGTSQFLTVQLEEARRRLIEQEQKLEVYRLQHSGELPSQAAGNLQQVQNLQVQVQNVVESLNRDVDRKLIIERALADQHAADAQAAASATRSVTRRQLGSTSDRAACGRGEIPQ